MTCKDCDKHEVCRRIDYELEYHNKSVNEAESELAQKCRLFKNKAENAEKKHGKWEQKPSKLGGNYSIFACSVCDKAFTFHPNYDFCPGCGADMREGAE